MAVTTNTPRPGLRQRLLERWTPLFDDDVAVTSLTAEEFATACGWDALRAAGTVTASEDPLDLAGLRLSTIFPRHLLRRRDDGRLVPVSLEEATGLVRIALAQQGRSVTTIAAPEADAADLGATGGASDTTAADAVTDPDGDDRTAGDSRRRFFFRRRPDRR